MGIYLNPGNDAFQEAINSPVYVDKTELIVHTNAAMNTYGKFICVSRPRRFGKTMAADMLVSYYSSGCDSSALFADKKITEHASYSKHLNRHNVIRIDIQQFLYDESAAECFITDLQRAVVRELIKTYPECTDLDSHLKLDLALNEIFSLTGQKFIFIIDEWDCVFRIVPDKGKVQKRYLDFLRSLFKGSVFIDLVYMTGILPIKKYGEHSAVNMFTEFSMTDPKSLSQYYGYTREEVLAECKKRNLGFQEMENWYDGYLVGDTHIYNPKSVNDALIWNEVQSYWTGTETYDALRIYIERNYDGLRQAIIEMLGGGSCRVDTASFQNDMTTFRSKDDILTLLVHLGYLTYDKKNGRVHIPNLEVKQEFIRAIKNGSGWDGLIKSLNRSLQLLEATWHMNGEEVASLIESIHSETSSLLKYHDENSLTCVLYIAYYSASNWYMNPIAEMPSGKGRADIVYLPRKESDKPALIIELKWNKSAESAVSQIKDKEYSQWIEGYTGDILMVGINYDTKSKKHSCHIEKYTKGGPL